MLVDVESHASTNKPWTLDQGLRTSILVYVDVVVTWGEIVRYADSGLHAWVGGYEDVASGIMYVEPDKVEIRRCYVDDAMQAWAPDHTVSWAINSRA